MNVSYRIFLVDENSVSKISQRTFNKLYLRGEAALPQFAGQTKTFAFVTYILESRKPIRIIRIDCERMRIGESGELDQSHERRRIDLAFERAGWDAPATSPKGENVVNATARFNDKAWRNLHPELSGPALKQILDTLF